MPHSVHPTPRSNTPQDQNQNTDIGEYYWNINQPRSQWTAECPEFLLGQNAKNIGILSRRKDENRPRITWEEARELARKLCPPLCSMEYQRIYLERVKTNEKGHIGTRRIHHFERDSLSLRAYLEYIHHLKKTYGSVLAFIQQERLHWEDIVPSGDAHFSNAADFKVLYNDWPYHIDPDITHLIVWTKWQMDDEPDTEEPTVETRTEVEEFIRRTFCSNEPEGVNTDSAMDRERIIWFKNWKSLKSVHALEHVHVMLYQAPKRLLDRVTAGDRPVSESWTAAAASQ